MDIAAPQLEHEKLELRVDWESTDTPVFGTQVFELDARAELQAICDFILARAQPDTKLYSPNLPNSVPSVIKRGNLNHDDRLYICYGTLGLADVIKPMVSMDGWK
ncbi:MAG: hypothetical protein PHO37_11645 [Kiritimatiellae bacterium]|nr:hypothetical protein [Kiritimatiellia bacterium]